MNSLLVKFDDSLNAILVKELRQTVRGKFFWGLFNIFLVVLCFILLSAMGDDVSDWQRSNSIEYLFYFLFFVCFCLIPVYIGKKVSSDSSDGTNELLMVTTMSPRSIISGKYLCGASVILMLYCAFAPFMSLMIFLGGVDLGDFLLALTLSFIVSQLAILAQVSMWISANKNGGFGQFVRAVGFFVHFAFWSFLQGGLYAILNGRFFMEIDMKPLNFSIMFIFGSLLIGILMFVQVVSQIEPDNYNKAYALRKIATIVWVVFAFVGILSPNIMQAWSSITLISLVIYSFAINLEPEDYSKRVVKEIPKSFWRKLVFFPFFTGVTNGFCWILLLSFCTAIFSPILYKFHEGWGSYYSFKEGVETISFYISIVFYANAYGFLGLFIKRVFFKSSHRNVAVIISLICYFILGWSLYLFDFVFRLRHFEPYMLKLFNPIFILDRPSEYSSIFVFSVFFLFISLILNLNTILSQLSYYFNRLSYEDKQ